MIERRFGRIVNITSFVVKELYPNMALSNTVRVALTGAMASLAREAIQHGVTVKVLAADHQNKPHIGLQTARSWFDVDGVDMIVDVPNSAVVLAVQQLAKEKNRVLIVWPAAPPTSPARPALRPASIGLGTRTAGWAIVERRK